MLRLGGTFPLLLLGTDDRLADERKAATNDPSTSTGPEVGAQTTTGPGLTAQTSEKTG
jgi:hypothetical protein